MTAIAAKVGVGMAADTGQFMSNVYMTGAKKLWRLNDGSLFGGVGLSFLTKKYVEFFNGERRKPPNLQEIGATEAEVIGLLLTRKQIYVVETDASLTPTHSDYFALGAGMEFCLGAMFAGLSPDEAVRAAMKHCQHVAGEVVFERIG